MPFIICDTDFLIKATTQPLPALAGLLSTSGYELSTLPRIERELKGLAQSRKPTTSRNAKTALRAISTGVVKLLEQVTNSSQTTDADLLLIDYAMKSNATVIATLDHTLLSILERKRLPYLTLRNDRPILKTF
jgi:rRNA-processing protein FCF1